MKYLETLIMAELSFSGGDQHHWYYLWIIDPLEWYPCRSYCGLFNYDISNRELTSLVKEATDVDSRW